MVQRGKGPNLGESFGGFVQQLGDVDGDGLGDLLIGDGRDNTSSGGINIGMVRVLSGVHNQRLHSLVGSGAGSYFGDGVGRVGDVDDDGIQDFAVRSWGRVETFSGADASLIHTTHDPTIELLGYRMEVVGDQDDDGVPDTLMFAQGWPGTSGWHVTPLISGATGGVIRVHNEVTHAGFGAALCALSDVTGDGLEEYLVSAPTDSTNSFVGGSVFMFRGGDGALIRHHVGSAGQKLGTDLANVGDVDGDGVNDYMLIDDLYNGAFTIGRAFLHSGSTGNLLYEMDVEGPNWGQLLTADGVGDVDGDGYSDYVLCYSEEIDGENVQHVILYSGFGPLGIRSCSPAVPNSTGQSGALVVRGSANLEYEWFQLDAYDLPAGEFGLFLMSDTQGALTPPGSQGVMCLGAPLQRISVPSMSDGSGRMSHRPDLGGMPLVPGQTVHFQAWYRDGAAGTSNFTDAVTVQFE